jgi:DNA polymerase-3 subunit beta
MRASFHAGVLLAALEQVKPVVPAKSPKPILQQVKLICGNGEARLVANDLEIGISCTIKPLSVDGAGQALLPPDKTITLLKNVAKDAEIRIVSDDRKTEIVTDKGRSNHVTEDASLFPGIPVIEFGENGFSVDHKQFAAGINQTVLSTDPDSTRYALGGVCFAVDPDANILDMIATDGRRLCRYTLPVNLAGGSDSPVIPSKALQLVAKIKGEEFCDVAMHKSHVSFRTSKCTITARTLEGRFPRWQDVIPESSKTKVFILPKELTGAIASAAVTTSEESRGVTLAFEPDVCTASSKSADAGSSLFGFEAKIEGDPVTVTVDPRYLVPHLHLLGDTPAEIKLNSRKESILVKAPDFQLVVMPLTVEE